MQELDLSLKQRAYRKICKVFMTQIPDKKYIELLYEVRTGKKLNLQSPKTYNEKLNWLKLYYHNNELTKMADKITAKEIVSESIGSEYVVPIIGIWEKAEDIDYEKLPNSFVLKCNHDSGSVVICKDKKSFDIKATKEKLQECLSKNYYYYSREWAYKNIEPKIIAEPYLEDFECAELRDYKFFCFDGEVKFLYVATDRFKENEEVKFTFFDSDYNYLPVVHGHPYAEPLPKKPAGYEKMKELAGILSKGLPHVRVDFYEANGKIFFSEFTFYNNSGFLTFQPDEWDSKFGEYLNLPAKV